MRHLLTFASIVILASSLCLSAAGQQSAVAPFLAGEKLEYEAKIGRFKLSAPVADLTFTIEPATEPEQLIIRAKAVSKGTLIRLFRFSFLQEIESLVDFRQSRVFRTTKHDVQKKRVRDSIATFDYATRRVSYTETDPNDPRRPPRRIGSAIGDEVHDLITGIYSLRRQPMKVGRRFEMAVSDSGLVYKIPVRIVAREQQRTVLGRVWCWRVEPIIFGRGRMMDQRGKMTLWITDDTYRVPVKAELETTYGEIDIRLKAFVQGRKTS